MVFEKKYWSAKEFTDANGNEFTGYVGISDGKAYNFVTSEKLVAKNIYTNRISLSDNNFDRVLSEELKLPFEKKDVTFPANDFLHARTIKTAIERLQANNDYLFKNAIISNSILPAANECILLSSLVDKDGNFDKNSPGILGKWNFTSSALSSKTQDDETLYAQTKNETKYYAKTKFGEKSESIDENTLFKTVEQYSEEYEGEGDAESTWKELFGSNVNDSETVTMREIVSTSFSGSNDKIIKDYVYSSFLGKKIQFNKVTGTQNVYFSADATRLEVKSFGFIINSSKGPDKIICRSQKTNKDVEFGVKSVYTAGDGYFYVIYNISNSKLSCNPSDIISISGLNDFEIAYSVGTESDVAEVLFSCEYAAGDTDAPSYYNSKTLPNAVRTAKYSFVWKADNDADEQVAPYSDCTYQYLKETTEWRTAPNPSLVFMPDSYNNERDFIPDDTMTAKDVYSHLLSNYNSYRYPKLKRKVTYSIVGTLVNSNYKTRTYSTNSYQVETGTTEEISIVKSYKTPEEVYNDLKEIYYEADDNIDTVDKIYSKIPDIVQETYTVIDDSKIKHDFNSITASEILVRDVDKNSCNIIVFLLFKTKLLLFKTKYYFSASESGGANYITSLENISDDLKINLNDAIVIDHINPHDDSSLKFLSLNAIKIHKNTLYLVDNKLDMVLRYNIDWLINPNETITNALKKESIILTDILQGYGTSTDKIYFDNPYSIDVSDNYVYIVDRDNKCVKVYSSNLNFIKTLKNGYFSTHDIQAVAVNPYPCKVNGVSIGADSVWIVSVSGSRIFISILEDDIVKVYGQIEHISLLQDDYSWLEEVRGLKFSKTHSNYFYLVTTKRVYKLHVSKPFYPLSSLSYFKQRSIIGTMRWTSMKYQWHNIPSIFSIDNIGSQTSSANEVTWDYLPPSSSAEILDNKCFCLTENPAIEGDIIFHFGILYDNSKVRNYIKKNKQKFGGSMTFYDINSGELADMIKSSAMLLYVEPDSFISTVSNNEMKIYDTYKIEDNIDEDYINALTINKILYALVHNLVKIKNSLIGHYRAATNLDNVIVYDNVVLNDYFAKLELGESQNYFIHPNEVMSILINRPFEKIYNLQEKILDKMQTEFMAAQSYVNNASRLI